jgi:predicted acylesterase/phospholipase RssA
MLSPVPAAPDDDVLPPCCAAHGGAAARRIVRSRPTGPGGTRRTPRNILSGARQLRSVIRNERQQRPQSLLSEAGSRAQRRIFRATRGAHEIVRRLRTTWRQGAPSPVQTRDAGSLTVEVGPGRGSSLAAASRAGDSDSGYDLALVLSGGGARGFAHVGVLEIVEELQLAVDLVVGVSMGSIIGAGYAAGLSSAQMANLARAMRLLNVFRPRPGRLNLVDPAGIRAVISRIFGDLRFADLERELVVVSSSLTTGEHVVIRDGPVVDAIVASCAIPLVFPPVSRDGHLLLDGGLIDGLPISIARSLGARRIVAVDASTHARHVLRLPVLRHATRGVVRLLDRRPQPPDLDAVRIFSRVLHHATLSPARPPVELLIRPAFGRRSTLHYHRWSDMVACGRAAAEAARPRLTALAPPSTVPASDAASDLR